MLEVIVNTAMIVEVGIRFFAFGKVRFSLPPISPRESELIGNRSGNVAILGFILQHVRFRGHSVVCRDVGSDILQRLFSKR